MRFALTVSMLAFSTVAVAQDAAPQRPMLSDACRAEVIALCPPTGDRSAMRECRMTNVDKLSTGCKAEMAKMRADREKMRGNRGGSDTPMTRSDDNGATPSERPM